MRERLGVLGDGGTTYDKALAEAVKKFQKEHQIAATGTLTAATLDALNGPRPEHVERHHPRQYGTLALGAARIPRHYVIVNLPDFTLRVMHDGKQVWKTKIVIGKPECRRRS